MGDDAWDTDSVNGGKLWQNFKQPFAHIQEEFGLADKGYEAAAHCVVPHKRKSGHSDRVVFVPEDAENFDEEDASEEDEPETITHEEAIAFESNLAVLRSRCERFYSFLKRWKLMAHNDCAASTVEAQVQIILAIEHHTRKTDYDDDEFHTTWVGNRSRCYCDFKGDEMRDAARRHRAALIRFHGQLGDNTVAWPTKKSAHARKKDPMAPMSVDRHNYLEKKRAKKEDEEKKRREKQEERDRNRNNQPRKRPRS